MSRLLEVIGSKSSLILSRLIQFYWLMQYNWQLPDWPHFRYSLEEVHEELILYAQKSGEVSGFLRGLSEEDQTGALIEVMIAEAMKTSEIEGEYLSRPDVASSIRNKMGLNLRPEAVRDARARGAAELMVAVRNSWDRSINGQMLFDWHRILLQGSTHQVIGQWRSHPEPMQVVSGSVVDPVVHFEAPPSERVPGEMKSFIPWFNETRESGCKGPVRAALAHLYLESIHPFEDGNGRIGRALSEIALSQQLGHPVMLSLSRTIEASKKEYYSALQEAQLSNEVTNWIQYFVGVVLDAQTEAHRQVDFILRKSRFFDHFRAELSARQLKVIRRMLDEGPDGFEGGLNARKYVSLTQVSKATATRDLQDLAARGVLLPIGAGRGARYELNL
jgi:Fic family protein